MKNIELIEEKLKNAENAIEELQKLLYILNLLDSKSSTFPAAIVGRANHLVNIYKKLDKEAE